MVNSEEQINILNTWCKLKLAPSKIHGVGVFALRPILKGQKCYADQRPEIFSIPYSSFNKLFPEIKEFILSKWPQVINGSRFIYPTERWQAYMNHSSDNPNYDIFNDMALRDIEVGEELLEDYRRIPNYLIVFPWLKEEPKKKNA
jgi:SET domain-containing protein